MPSRIRRIARRVFRWSCRLIVLLVLGLLVTAVYLERAGLPDFLKKRMVQALQARGWEVEFSSLRFHLYRGVIAENLHLRRAENKPGPIIFVDEAACHLDRKALRTFNVVLDSVGLRGGRIVWPFSDTNHQTARFQLDKVGGELVFKAGDLWELRSLSAEALGARLEISGTLSNASLVRDWKIPKSSSQSAEATQALWRKIATGAERIKFFDQPQLVTRFEADAGEFRRLDAELRFTATGVETPWGNATAPMLRVRIFPAKGLEPLQADLEFTAEDPATEWCRARRIRLNWEVEPPFISLFPTNGHVAVDLLAPETPWAASRRAVATVHVSSDPANSEQFRTDIEATLDHLQSEWIRSDRSQLTTSWLHSPTNLYPSRISGELRVSNPGTRWGEAAGAAISLTAKMPAQNKLALFQTNCAWPNRLHGVSLTASVVASNVLSPDLQIDTVNLGATWDSSRLDVRTELALYGGSLTATGQLDSVTREALFSARSTFDPYGLLALLTPTAQSWVSNYTWRAAPTVQVSGRGILPAWTNRDPDWRGEVRPGLSLAGSFDVGQGAFRDAPFTSASSPFTLTNLLWRIPDLKVVRPEGTLHGEYWSDLTTRDFHWRVQSRINPTNARPVLEREFQRRALDYFTFSEPPEIDAEVWSRWGDFDRLGFSARVRATNFSFRGETVTAANSGLYYTNKVLVFDEPQVWQGRQKASAPKVVVDFLTEKLFLTNAFGNLDPNSVARAIGEKPGQAVAPYQFDAPPASHVNGVVDLKKGTNRADDLHFVINGGPFRWRQFRLQLLGGNIDWVGDKLSLNNVRGQFRQGDLGGAAAFDFTRGSGSRFAFNLSVSNADLRTFMQDIGYPTNKLEGVLNGEMIIGDGKTSDDKSWQGRGNVVMRDGLLWDIPMFGVLSPLLNSMIPGLGNSRAKEVTASFVITNSIIHSRDMEVRATAMRMNFDGTADFEGKLDARVEAELLRDLPGIGFVLSKILWPLTKLFEIKVTGTVNHPKTEPLYILPKLLLMPFHPIKTIKEMAPPDELKAPPK